MFLPLIMKKEVAERKEFRIPGLVVIILIVVMAFFTFLLLITGPQQENSPTTKSLVSSPTGAAVSDACTEWTKLVNGTTS